MFEIGKEYWFNMERKANCLKDTCKGILQNIYSDGTKTLYSFTDVRIYERMDDECLDYDFYGTYDDTTVFEKDIFNTAIEAFNRAKIDYENEINTIRDEIKTLEDLLRFPLSYIFSSDYCATDIYKEKVKEITGIDIEEEYN